MSENLQIVQTKSLLQNLLLISINFNILQLLQCAWLIVVTLMKKGIERKRMVQLHIYLVLEDDRSHALVCKLHKIEAVYAGCKIKPPMV